MPTGSRTSTTSGPIRGTPGIAPESIRATIPTEPAVSAVSTGPNTAPGSTVAGSVGPSYPVPWRIDPARRDAEARAVRILGLIVDGLRAR
ncbi:hypothetical protein [Streptomyces sp. NPDC048277]|uniref:hypothetical protein n=1 Tax=Streptomyces sp. NPDC048277 TaxID=3155027 RepID=UPI0033E65C22